MKDTGIIRKIDELGRIVIPKEIRRTLKLKEGTAVEIYINKDGEILLSKYSPFCDIVEASQNFCDIIYDIFGYNILVVDDDEVVSSCKACRGMQGKTLSITVQNFLQDRKPLMFSVADKTTIVELFAGEGVGYSSQIIMPIICNSEVIGGVIAYTILSEKELVLSDVKVLKSVAQYLAGLGY